MVVEGARPNEPSVAAAASRSRDSMSSRRTFLAGIASFVATPPASEAQPLAKVWPHSSRVSADSVTSRVRIGSSRMASGGGRTCRIEGRDHRRTGDSRSSRSQGGYAEAGRQSETRCRLGLIAHPCDVDGRSRVSPNRVAAAGPASRPREPTLVWRFCIIAPNERHGGQMNPAPLGFGKHPTEVGITSRGSHSTTLGKKMITLMTRK